MHTCLAAWCLLWAVPQPPPPLSDLNRFPPLWLVQQHLSFAASHQTWLQLRIDTEPSNRDDLVVWLVAARRSAESWVIVEGIHQGYDEWAGFTSYHTEMGKRLRLLALRDLLGWRAYHEGVLPPCVPLRYFQLGYDVPVLTPAPARFTCKQKVQ